MLTQKEEDFIVYWEQNRVRRRKVYHQLAVGLPLGVAIVIATFVNFFSGWYKRADNGLRTDPSMIYVLLIAAVLIVIFVTVFSARHKWDMYEQRYRELIARRDQS